MDIKYNHKKVEENKYDFWLNKNLFESKDKSKEPFTIVIPPPNITGNLHLGHAWDNTLQDIIIRFKRMQGYDALYLPGMDHAGIATQARIDAKLKSEGIDPRSLKREEWMEHAWEWTKKYKDNIKNQWAILGLSLSYSKEKFTLDKDLSEVVTNTFVKMYNDNLIYRGERIINWDPVAMTALSNEEVIHKEVKGTLYYIKYKVVNSDDYLVVATTRPETIFGDTAVAINPKDNKYKEFLNREVIVPLTDRSIKVITDDYVDMEFGTGVVKITPAHDPNDFEIGERHNLDKIICIDKNGVMNKHAFEFEGLDRFVARDQVVTKLKEENLLVKEEEIIHNVGHSERTDVMIEPYLSKQWFVKMRPLADRVLINQKDKNNKVNFYPDRFEKIMNHWMEITYDWCISRQLWWGHQIPAWYKGDEVYVSNIPPKEEGWVQDPDVLDTWFSSALWPFSTLDYLNQGEDYKRYYPNNVLVTGYDIIPFWVNRMTFQGLYLTDNRPFKDCLIHGLIRDEQGRKMSKSLGNGVDPLDVINDYGTDALRLFLTTSSAPGLDLRYSEEKVKSSWNFLNKLWNASRYVLINTGDIKKIKLKNLSNEDKWILTKLHNSIKEITTNMEKYEFHLSSSKLISFVWNDFCDNYIETSKYNMNDTTKSVLLYVLENILKLLHPFSPFITEDIYQKLPVKLNESIMVDEYPIFKKEFVFNEEKDIDNMLEFVKTFRSVKKELNIGKDFGIKLNNDENYILINNLLKLNDKLNNNNFNKEVIVQYKNYSLTMYYNETVIEMDIEKEIQELESIIIKRKSLLNNKNFLDKAPSNLVESEKQKLKAEELELIKLKSML